MSFVILQYVDRVVDVVVFVVTVCVAVIPVCFVVVIGIVVVVVCCVVIVGVVGVDDGVVAGGVVLKVVVDVGYDGVVVVGGRCLCAWLLWCWLCRRCWCFG